MKQRLMLLLFYQCYTFDTILFLLQLLLIFFSFTFLTLLIHYLPLFISYILHSHIHGIHTRCTFHLYFIIVILYQFINSLHSSSIGINLTHYFFSSSISLLLILPFKLFVTNILHRSLIIILIYAQAQTQKAPQRKQLQPP